MPQTHQRLIAGGTVNPFRFVMMSTAADHTGLQATANAELVGIAGEETKFAPLDDLVTTNPHATVGQPLNVRGPGEEALVEAGAAFSAGVRLKADTNGKAVAVATSGTTNQNYGAIAQQAANAEGDLVRVSVELGTVRPAIA